MRHNQPEKGEKKKTERAGPHERINNERCMGEEGWVDVWESNHYEERMG